MSQEVGSADGAVTAHRDGAVLRLTLDRPARRNSLSHSMVDTLVGALTDAASDDALRVIHIRGAGDDFCAGADWVATNAGCQRPRTGDLVRRIPHTGPPADRVGPHHPPPRSPDSGSTWFLSRLVGLARAKRMLLLGEKVTASDAADWGLIHSAVGQPELDAAADDLVARLGSGPTVAIGLAKQAIHYGQHATLPQTMNQELFNLALSCRTTDFKEDLAAFRERRTPEFHGR